MQANQAGILNNSQRHDTIAVEQFGRYLLSERASLIQRLGAVEDQLIEMGKIEERSIVPRRKRGEH
jgi:hypothetical protein